MNIVRNVYTLIIVIVVKNASIVINALNAQIAWDAEIV